MRKLTSTSYYALSFAMSVALSSPSFAQEPAGPPPSAMPPAPSPPPAAGAPPAAGVPPSYAPPPLNRAAVYDPAQFPAQRGQVMQFTLSPRGDIDGLILQDGTEVKTRPELSTQIAYSIKRGDRVTIHGLRAAALPLVLAVSITDDATHRTVVEDEAWTGAHPASPAPRGAAAPPATPPRGDRLSEVTGRVRMLLHGPQGEVNGVLLDSGTIWRVPPDQADQMTSLLQPHQTLVAQGVTVASSLGTVVDVQQLGRSRDRLIPLGPRMPVPMPPPGAGPGAAPPPPPAG